MITHPWKLIRDRFFNISLLTLMVTAPAGTKAEQQPIVIDGQFTDWSESSTAYMDAIGDGAPDGIDFGQISLADDSQFLFLRIHVGTELDASENNDLRLFIDTDGDSKTGLGVADIGAELEWRFGTRMGTFYVGSGTDVFAGQLKIRGAPTVSSNEFEFAIGKDTIPDGINPLFSQSQIRIALIDFQGGDRVPEVGETISYEMDQGELPPETVIPISRNSPTDLRLITHNVLNDGPWQPELEERFGRQWAAVCPDILNLQEIYNHSAAETVQLVTNWVALHPEEDWHAAKNNDCITVSRYPILNTWSLDGNLAVLIDTKSILQTEILIINAHLPCCGNEFGRQFEVDRIMSFIRDAKSSGGEIDVAPNTPIIVTGDLNLVGLAQQLTTLITGDIVNSEFGLDFMPDWDETNFANVITRQTEKRMGYTWRNDFSSFWPGQLDYFIYSDSVIQKKIISFCIRQK